MAEIFEFPKKAVLQKELKDLEPTLRLNETAQAIERVILAISENRLEEESVVVDMEALKDIFSIFSVKEREMVDRLSEAELEGKITRNDKILLFLIFVTFKNQDFQADKKIKNYLLKISQKTKIEIISP